MYAQFYNIIVRPIMMYGSERWTVEDECNKDENIKVGRVTWEDKIRNMYIRA